MSSSDLSKFYGLLYLYFGLLYYNVPRSGMILGCYYCYLDPATTVGPQDPGTSVEQLTCCRWPILGGDDPSEQLPRHQSVTARTTILEPLGGGPGPVGLLHTPHPQDAQAGLQGYLKLMDF